MGNSDELISAAMLEAIWSSKKMDIVDLMTPFILMGVSELASVGEQIDLSKVAVYVSEQYGYRDFPQSVVEKILKRNRKGYFKKSQNAYILVKSLDKEVNKLEKRKIECKERTDRISSELSKYLSSHCKQSHKYDKEQTLNALQGFFSRNGIDLESHNLIEKKIDSKLSEADYYIARFIYEKEQTKDICYDYILSLVKGYFLKTALYLQPNNGNLGTAAYSDTVFYYDTPFLLNLLGFQSTQEEKAARELHSLLKKQKGRFACFPQTYDEIISILTAYQYSLSGNTNNWRTLEGLDSKKYTSSDVDRIKTDLPNILRKDGIQQLPVPPYPTNENGSVDVSKVLAEEEIKTHIRTKIKHYKDASLDRDVCSVIGIYHLRNCERHEGIENCKAIFVTTNQDFTNAFNDYYKKNIDKEGIPLIITDIDLSAITWIKTGNYDDNIPSNQLLVNSYMSMQPSSEVMEQFNRVILQIQSEGGMTAEEALTLRTSRYVSNEIMITSWGDSSDINEEYVEKISDNYKKHVQEESREQHAKEAIQETTKKQIIRANKEASKIAAKKKETLGKFILLIVRLLLAGVISVCIIFIIHNIVQNEYINFTALFVEILLAVISAIGLVDTILNKYDLVKRMIQKCCNRYETRILEKEKREFMNIIQVDQENYNDDFN